MYWSDDLTTEQDAQTCALGIDICPLAQNLDSCSAYC